MINPMHLKVKVLLAAWISAAICLATFMPTRPAHAQKALPSHEACNMSKKRTCDELVQDNILWKIDEPDSAASKHWLQKNLDALCGCTTDPYATVNCFQIQVNNNHKTWQEAISVCRANHE